MLFYRRFVLWLKFSPLKLPLFIVAIISTSGLLYINSGTKWPKFLSGGPSVSFQNRNFVVEGREIQIISGAVHYFRVPPEYWYDRLRKLKICGLNTVETYVPWNVHEKSPGKFDFSAQLNVIKFIEIAQELGLYVILRPGPYICAEWDWGGLPGWLLRDPNMRVRTNYPGYQTAVKEYLSVLIPKILPYQMNRGGPIIMVQVENEYGSYRQDNEHVAWLRDLFIELGVTELLFTSDGFEDGRLSAGSAPAVLAVVNDQAHIGAALDSLKEFQPDLPLMIGEFWSGWFDHWNESHHTYPIRAYEENLKLILTRGASVNLFMFHGGTNFGFTNGANMRYPQKASGDEIDFSLPGRFQPTVTSYDYDALLTENGQITDKYLSTCRIISQFQKFGSYVGDLDELQTIRQKFEPPTKNYGVFGVKKYLTITEALRFLSAKRVDRLVPMEMICSAVKDADSGCLGQNLGFIAYRTYIPSGGKTIDLKLRFADRAVIVVNNKTMATVESYIEDKVTDIKLNFPDTAARDLIILVENMGRVNYQRFPKTLDTQRKGIVEGQGWADSSPINEWHVYSVEMDKRWVKHLKISASWHPFENGTKTRQPTFYRIPLGKQMGQMRVDEWPADTFLDTKGWNKGVAFANWFNLGRYWKTGPQRTLFVPGPRLAARTIPEITMFELHRPNSAVSLISDPKL